MQNIDVLIVGGGPTGVALGLELAAQKIPFRIIDKAPSGRSDKSRSLVVQPRTFELLNRHGIARDLQERGNTADGVTFCVNGKEVVGIEIQEVAGLPNTAFPFQSTISQHDTEIFLDEALAKYGFGVEWEVRVKSITQDADGVTVKLGKNDNTTEETVRAKFVVGCDGKHSIVRDTAGLVFEGDSYPQDFILADTHVKWGKPYNRAYLCFGRGMLVMLPIKDDMVRVVAVRATVTQRQGDPLLEDFQKAFSRMVPGGGTLHDAAWLARFYLHHRGVNRYNNGRLFVAGDAAHVHSPVGAQGMNTGIQDSVNLGWKLAAVLRGERPMSFLDSYDAERRPVGQKLLKTTDKAFKFVSSINPIFVFFRNLILPWILPWVMGDRSRVQNIFNFMAEFDVTYRGSGIVGSAPGLQGCKIQGGDRVLDGKIEGPEGQKYLLGLLDATRHHLLLFSGVGSESATEGTLRRAEAEFLERSPVEVKVHTVFGRKPNGESGYVDVDGILHRELGFQQAAYILVRPDAYAAHVGPLSALDALPNWLKQLH
ncbi:hypothetical protein DL769_011091 [Monosporascus sp. CRB-8-3]|nr:hypothetical protein DL769_011091 [Monosporascus sp. CRB-8-3]